MSHVSSENVLNPSATALLEMQPVEATSVIIHRVPEALTDKFLDWQRGVTASAEQCEGYLRTEVYPPAPGRQTHWVIVIHFENHEALHHWLQSPQRAKWIAELATDLSDFTIKTLPQGFGPWFAEADAQEVQHVAEEPLPPSWKMALVVLLALYPTVMLLSLLVMPWLSGLGFALAMFISNALSVSILQWGIMPRLTRWLDRWLTLPRKGSRRLNIGGTLTILALLVCLVVLFQWLAAAR